MSLHNKTVEGNSNTYYLQIKFNQLLRNFDFWKVTHQEFECKLKSFDKFLMFLFIFPESWINTKLERLMKRLIVTSLEVLFWFNWKKNTKGEWKTSFWKAVYSQHLNCSLTINHMHVNSWIWPELQIWDLHCIG